MMNALVIAAIQHFVLAGTASGMFAGVRLGQSSDWARVQDALKELVARVFVGSDPTHADGG
jgi:hypothetical protein